MKSTFALTVADGQFTDAVFVSRDDEVLLIKGYGSANLEWVGS